MLVGDITIVKSQQESLTFDRFPPASFTGRGPEGFDFGGGFRLDTDFGDHTLPGHRSFENLPAGVYTVTESDALTLHDITCRGTSADNVRVNRTDGSVTITLIDGESVKCVFFNQAFTGAPLQVDVDDFSIPQGPHRSAGEQSSTVSAGIKNRVLDAFSDAENSTAEAVISAGVYTVDLVTAPGSFSAIAALRYSSESPFDLNNVESFEVEFDSPTTSEFDLNIILFGPSGAVSSPTKVPLNVPKIVVPGNLIFDTSFDNSHVDSISLVVSQRNAGTAHIGVDRFSVTQSSADPILPYAATDLFAVPTGRVLEFSLDELLLNDWVAEGNALSLTQINGLPASTILFLTAENGTVVFDSAESVFSYTPAPEFVGRDTLTYTIESSPDAGDGTNLGAVLIDVLPGADADPHSSIPYFSSPIEPNLNPLAPVYGVDPCGCACVVQSCDIQDAGSVYLHSGEFFHDAVDLVIPGRGIDWTFARKYRSGVSFDGPLGHNWELNYSRRMVEVTDTNLASVLAAGPNVKVGDVVRMDGNTRVDLYVLNPDGTYTAPAGFYTSLEKDADGNLTERDGQNNRVSFGLPDAGGVARMSSISDRSGNTLSFQHDESGRLVRVVDTLGRPIHYEYNAEGRLQYVRDFADRTIVLDYDANGDLVAVTSPLVTDTLNFNEFPDGKTTRYGYSAGFRDERLNHNLLSITAPNEVESGGPARVLLVYQNDSAHRDVDRVVGQTIAGTNASNVPAGGTISYEYARLQDNVLPDDFDTGVTQTIVTDRTGNRTEYQFNQLGNVVRKREFTNRNVRDGDPEFFETSHGYNRDGQLTRSTLPEGNSVVSHFDDGGADRLRQGNQLTTTAIADAERGGDQVQLTTMVTYEPIFNQVHTLTEPRGSDASYVPQNGGTHSAERYTTHFIYDYEESCDFAAIAASVGRDVSTIQLSLSAAGMCSTPFGDVNGDGVTDQIAGNLIQIEAPDVNLLVGSNQATVEGDTTQPIISRFAYNRFSQLVASTDPEGNVTTYEYYPENDPDGNGEINNPNGDAETGGYVKQRTIDALSGALRNSGTNPTPAAIRTAYAYDEVGNVIREIDGRGIATEYVINQLNQVIQTTHSATHNLGDADPQEPLPLVDFQYVERYAYDANNNLVRYQLEDRGNTSNVGVLGDVNGDGAVDEKDIDTVFGVIASGVPSDGLDLNMDGVLDDKDVDILVRDVVGTAYGDANLDGMVAFDDFLRLASTFGGLAGWAGGDFDGNGRAEFPDFLQLATNFGVKHTLKPLRGFVDYSYTYDILDQLVEETTEVGINEELVTRYRYDANGNAVLTVLPEGNAMTAIFDERDLLFQSTNGAAAPHAQTILSAFDVTNFDVRGGTPSTETLYFDGNRNLVESVDAADTDGSINNNHLLGSGGDRARFLYDGFDRLTSTIDAVGNQTVMQYDPASNIVRAATFGRVGGDSSGSDGFAGGPVSLNGVIQTASLVLNNQNTLLEATEYSYDEMNRVYQTDDVLFVNTIGLRRAADVADGATDVGGGNVTPDDDQGIPGVNGVTIIGRVTNRDEYDRNSRTTFIVEDDTDTYTMHYDGVNRMIHSIDPEGNSVETVYDDNSNVIEVRETDTSQVAGVADELFLTTYFFDSLNRLQQSVNNVGHSVEYRYDSRDNLVAIADSQGPLNGQTILRRAFASGPLTVNAINDYGNVTLYSYDGAGRLTTEQTILTANGAGDGQHIGASIEGVKDDMHAPESLVFPDSNQAGGDGRITIARDWDANSLLRSLTDDNGNQTAYAYDNHDRQLTETHGICVGDGLADSCGLPTTVTYEYDGDSNVVRMTDENGSVIRYQYDGTNRLVRTNVERGSGVIGTTQQIYEYDGLSRMTRASDNNEPLDVADDSNITYAYDSLSRIIEETQQIGRLQSVQTVSSAWRSENLLASVVYPNERKIEYTYDDLDRLNTIGDAGTALPIVDYDYIGTDRVLVRAYPLNGTRMTYLDDDGTTVVGYDGLRRTTQLRHLRNDNSMVVAFTYDYDRMNNKLGEGKLHNAVNSEVYGYDSAYRLVNFERPDPEAVVPKHGQFTLDGVGNWTQVDNELREHSSFNEISSRDDGGVAIRVTYDGNGNLTNDGKFTFAWDYHNRLQRVIRNSDSMVIADYAYDAEGRRVRKIVSNLGELNGTTSFYYDDWQVIEEHKVTAQLVVARQFVYGSYIDEVLIMDDNLDGDGSTLDAGDQRFFYHQNSQVSVVAITNSAGQIVEGYLYEAYGGHAIFTPGPNGIVEFGGDDVIVPGGSSLLSNPYLFQGRRLDIETGLYYFRARHYAPDLGRFLQRDPLGHAADMNVYAFAGSNPPNKNDPMGLEPDSKSPTKRYKNTGDAVKDKGRSVAVKAGVITAEITGECLLEKGAHAAANAGRGFLAGSLSVAGHLLGAGGFAYTSMWTWSQIYDAVCACEDLSELRAQTASKLREVGRLEKKIHAAEIAKKKQAAERAREKREQIRKRNMNLQEKVKEQQARELRERKARTERLKSKNQARSKTRRLSRAEWQKQVSQDLARHRSGRR